jgi:chemotaxis protein methyltransferase CheR
LNANPNPAAVTDHELAELRALIERRSGIMFEGVREQSFAARVRAQVAEKGWAHGSALLRAIRASNAEFEYLLERVLTQETSFFRYPDVFDALQKVALPELQKAKAGQDSPSLRIWSAGCATGEEPYSIAFAVAESMAAEKGWQIEILATDVSRTALQQAERGTYSKDRLRGMTAAQIDAWFSRQNEEYAVKPEFKSLVSFAPLNLAEAVYPGRFDCIFCMNVLIYFSPELRRTLIQQFYRYLEPGGFLFLGHAETATGTGVNLRALVHGETRLYRKPGFPTAPEGGANAGRSQS